MRARQDDSRGFARRKVGAEQCLRAKARRRCRAKALNNHQAPSLANRLRRFANLGAFFLHMCAARVCRGLVTSGQEKCLRLCGLRSFFFHPLCLGFYCDGWRRAALDSVRELFTDLCKRNPTALDSVCRAKTLNNHQAPSLANRLRRFANESAGGLSQMGRKVSPLARPPRIFFFHSLCLGFFCDGWRQAALGSVRELFTDMCKRKCSDTLKNK